MNTKNTIQSRDTTTPPARFSQRRAIKGLATTATSPVNSVPVALTPLTYRKPSPTKSLPDPMLALVEPSTVIEAKIDVGLGNQLFIRGQGNGLNWFEGVRLCCRDANTWVWSSRQAKDRVVFKLLLNDQVWAKGNDLVVEPGQKIEVVPFF
jgi:hypothetical protein